MATCSINYDCYINSDCNYMTVKKNKKLKVFLKNTKKKISPTIAGAGLIEYWSWIDQSSSQNLWIFCNPLSLLCNWILLIFWVLGYSGYWNILDILTFWLLKYFGYWYIWHIWIFWIFEKLFKFKFFRSDLKYLLINCKTKYNEIMNSFQKKFAN